MSKSPEASRRTTPEDNESRKPHYGRRRVGAAILAITAVLGVTKGIEIGVERVTHETIIGSESFTLPEGGTVINSANQAITEIAVQHGVDPTEIPRDDVLYQAVAAASKSEAAQHTTVTSLSDRFVATVTKNSFGYHGSIEPDETTVTKP